MLATKLFAPARRPQAVARRRLSERLDDTLASGHRLTRAYAVALGAGTQAFTVGVGVCLLGAGAVNHDLWMVAAWAINLAVAEWIIRRAVRRARRARRGCTVLAGS